MAFGTLKADTLTHSTAGSLATNFVVEGSAKMWTSINMATPVIKDSLNTSSITDHSTGLFTKTATSAMNNGDYAVAATNIGDTQGSYALNLSAAGVANTTTQHKYYTYNTVNDTQHDATAAHTIVHGDLA